MKGRNLRGRGQAGKIDLTTIGCVIRGVISLLSRLRSVSSAKDKKEDCDSGEDNILVYILRGDSRHLKVTVYIYTTHQSDST